MSKTIKIGGRIESAEQGGVVTGANAILDDTKGKKQNVINSETDDELARLDSTKQDVLTFDNAPTEGSNNPVKSGGVYAADAALQQAIEAILLLIPSAASALNQLADKAFVNSTVATNTATFRGTYNVVTDLSLHYNSTHQEIATALLSVVQTADNNDYCFVQIPVSDSSGDIRVTERYKFNGTAWSYEYDLNNSGFTADQWAAINSGITAAFVGDLNEIKSYIPAEATALNKLADMAYVLAQIIANIPAFKGQFTTLSELQAVQSPKAGDCGIVRTKDNDGQDVFTFYQYLNGSWNVYYILSRHPQRKPVSTGVNGDYPFNGMGLIELPMNMREGWMNDTWLYYPVNGIVYLLYSWNFQLYAVYSNDEGLGLENNVVVKAANYNISDIADIVSNRYLPFTEDGGVYTITKPDSSTITSTELNNTTIINYNDPSYKGVNVLTQDMMSAANTKYVIKYDYELAEDITVPANCVLEFDGGSLRNGSIVGVLKITDCNYRIFNNINFVLEESFLYADYVRPEWFGAKGDYNYATGIGSDDTVAITKAIEAALVLKVYKVKFSSSTYYVNGTIEINSGDIVLEGVYGEYREDFKFSSSKEDISANKNSTLISDTDSPIIMTLQGGTHPVVIKHLNFVQVYNNNTLTNNTKGVWLKGWSGPQSPFIFENCNFHNFKYAIYIQSDTVAYNVSKLTINRCAFGGNYWCLYFDTTTAQNNYRLTTNATAKLTFTHNACHHNVRGISIALNIADGYVADNVFEGNLTSFRNSEIATEPYINYVGLHNASRLVFERNYFEQNTECHLRLNVTSLSYNYYDSIVTLKNNISVPISDSSYVTAKRCEIECVGGYNFNADAPNSQLHVMESDYDFDVLGGKFNILFHRDLKDVHFLGDSSVCIYTNRLPPIHKDENLNREENIIFFNNDPIGYKSQAIPTFFDGTIHYGFTSASGIGTVNIEEDNKKIAYFCLGLKICNNFKSSNMSMVNRALFSYTDNHSASKHFTIWYNDEFSYAFMITRRALNASIRKSPQFRSMNTPIHALISDIAIVYKYNDNISLSDVDWNFSKQNVVLLDKINDVTKQRVGDKLLLHPFKMECIYNGTKWVDSQGYTPAIHRGTTTQRNELILDASTDKGFDFYDTTLNKSVWWTGTVWVEEDGVVAGTPTSGTFANKPTVSANKIPIGFKYFCTDKQTTEGATDGIEIIYKGSNVWVDALGRVVS